MLNSQGLHKFYGGTMDVRFWSWLVSVLPVDFKGLLVTLYALDFLFERRLCHSHCHTYVGCLWGHLMLSVHLKLISNHYSYFFSYLSPLIIFISNYYPNFSCYSLPQKSNPKIFKTPSKQGIFFSISNWLGCYFISKFWVGLASCQIEKLWTTDWI